MRQLDDRVGLGWRHELAAGIFAHADRVDVVEVIADDHFRAGRAELRALRTLGTQVPIVLHGVGLGLASTEACDRRRLEAMARVVGAVEPELWSEHLAFVRGGGIEIGHLAAPPRNAATIGGVAANVAHARRIVGSAPVLENVATLVEPPGSDRGEAEWVAAAVDAADTTLLLDLHNLHANAANFGFDPVTFLDAIPMARIRLVHLAGGRPITAPDGRTRVLDDHLHQVPDPVYALLRTVARRAPHALTVILERDGRYPAMPDLLAELDRARDALRAGRGDRALGPAAVGPLASREHPNRPAASFPEAALARLYVDAELRARFRVDPAAAGPALGLDAAQVDAVARMNAADLALAAESFARKRAMRHDA